MVSYHESNDGRGSLGDEQHLQAVGIEGIFIDPAAGFYIGEALYGHGGRPQSGHSYE